MIVNNFVLCYTQRLIKHHCSYVECVATCSRLLRNRIYQEPEPIPELGHQLRVSMDPLKRHEQNIDKSIRMYRLRFAF